MLLPADAALEDAPRTHAFHPALVGRTAWRNGRGHPGSHCIGE